MAWRPVTRVIKQVLAPTPDHRIPSECRCHGCSSCSVLACEAKASHSSTYCVLFCPSQRRELFTGKKGDWPVGSDFHWGTSLVIQCLRIHLASDFCFMYLCFFIVKVYNGLWYLSSLWIVPFIIRIFIFVSFKINKFIKKKINLTIQGMQVWSLEGELRSHNEAQTPQLLSPYTTTRVHILQWKILRASAKTWCSQK